MNFKAALARVSNRGIPPIGFLTELVTWARAAADVFFLPNDRYDVYSSVVGELGPFVGLLQRKAAMCEVLRVLAGFESSWNPNEGVDLTNRRSQSDLRCQETGIFQVSFDSVQLSDDLKKCLIDHGVDLYARVFIDRMKSDHALALEYAARLLRVTVRANGPVLRKEINPCLSRQAAAEFQTLLAAS